VSKNPKANRPPRPHLREEPQVRVQLGGVFPLGPGKVQLIEAIARTGSISAAAREAEMSYRRAWVLIDEVNRSFRAPLVETTTGGKGGGGASITDLGSEVLRRYHDIENRVRDMIEREAETLSDLLAPTENTE
jgi:molybdate transport system regulatory protein